MSEPAPDKDFPMPDDPAGSRYYRDEDGDIVHDRREEEVVAAHRFRNGLIYCILGLMVLLTIGAVFSAFSQKRNADKIELESKTTDYLLRESQRDACENGQNELRADIRDEFVDLKLQGLVPFYEAVQSTVPPGSDIDTIIESEVTRLEQRAESIEERIPNNNCRAVYPLLDDPRTEDNEEGK